MQLNAFLTNMYIGCKIYLSTKVLKYIHKRGRVTGKLRVSSMSASQLPSEHPAGPISVPQLGADSSTH